MSITNQLVYLADDDEDDRFLLWKAFQQMHPQCLLFPFTHGQELLNHISSVNRPDLIMLDVNMPILNGLETLQQLRADKQWGFIPVVMVSTSSDKAEISRCYELGAQAFYTKPGSFSQLLRMIQELGHTWLSHKTLYY